MINIEQKGKGAIKEEFKLSHLFRHRLDVHLKYNKRLTGQPLDILSIAKLFPVKDQDGSGSCGGQAWAYLTETLKYIRDNIVVPLSAKDIYSHVWLPGGGSQETDLITFVENYGVDTEANVTSYDNGLPPSEAFMETISPRNVDVATQQIVYSPATFNGNDINQVKLAIDNGHGTVIALYGDNEGWQTNPVKVPLNKVWGHWLMCCSYSDKTQLVTVKNSWGIESGDQGYYYIPYEYFSNGNVMGAWCYILRPTNYYTGLLVQIISLLKNIISYYTK